MKATKITFNYDGEDFVLEFDKASAQSTGRDLSKADGEPIAVSEAMITGAFIKHHKNISKAKRLAIVDTIEDKAGFIEMLATLYAGVIEGTMENENAKTSWEVSE